jgi:hypothetical protein
VSTEPDRPEDGKLLALAIWSAAGISFLVLLGLTFAARGTLEALGNLPSVWCLWVAVVGFALTLQAVLETKRLTRATRQETRATVEKITLQLLQAECERVYQHVAEAIRAAESARWECMIDRLQLGQRDGIRLEQFAPLLETERKQLRAGVEEMNDIAEFVRAKIVPAAVPLSMGWMKELNDARALLQQLLSNLDRMLARLEQLVLETSHG